MSAFGLSYLCCLSSVDILNILDAHLEKIPTRKGRYVSVQNRFKRLLSDPAKDRPVLDAVASTAESVADIAIKDELLAAVPFVSTAFKVVKAMDSARDRLFAAKLQAFVAEVDTLDPTERMQLSKKLTADDGGRKAGETLLLVLDKITDMDKPAAGPPFEAIRIRTYNRNGIAAAGHWS
jgi:hypothetical protein